MLARVVTASAVVAAMLALAPAYSHAQRLFKCGASYQDRPCPAEDVQKRYSATAGSFSISQVNPDTDRDCAKITSEALPYWQRMNAGATFEAVKAEVDARPISRYEKSVMRDVLIALKQYKGTPRDVQSQLETQCMNHKRLRGLPTEQDAERVARIREARNAELEYHSNQARDGMAEARLRRDEERLVREDQAGARAAAAAARAAARSAAADRR